MRIACSAWPSSVALQPGLNPHVVARTRPAAPAPTVQRADSSERSSVVTPTDGEDGAVPRLTETTRQSAVECAVMTVDPREAVGEHTCASTGAPDSTSATRAVIDSGTVVDPRVSEGPCPHAMVIGDDAVGAGAPRSASSSICNGSRPPGSDGGRSSTTTRKLVPLSAAKELGRPGRSSTVRLPFSDVTTARNGRSRSAAGVTTPTPVSVVGAGYVTVSSGERSPGDVSQAVAESPSRAAPGRASGSAIQVRGAVTVIPRARSTAAPTDAVARAATVTRVTGAEDDSSTDRLHPASSSP